MQHLIQVLLFFNQIQELARLTRVQISAPSLNYSERNRLQAMEVVCVPCSQNSSWPNRLLNGLEKLSAVVFDKA